jgi:hypothetical protein
MLVRPLDTVDSADGTDAHYGVGGEHRIHAG